MIQTTHPPPSLPPPQKKNRQHKLLREKRIKFKENKDSAFLRVNMCIQITAVTINTSF